MISSVSPSIPIVAIGNIAEAFYEFLIDVPDAETHLRGEAYRGDRTVVWLGAEKMVITSLAIPHAEYLKHHAGYTGTCCFTPARNTHRLCRDIAEDPALLGEIVTYAGPDKSIQMAVYTATHEFYDLVDLLRGRYGLTVLLPENTERDHVWLRDYADTKSGYRLLAGRWLPDAEHSLLEGIVCQDTIEAAEAANWFLRRGQACIVKNEIGENGFGNVVLHPHEFADTRAIFTHLAAQRVLGRRPLTVEALVTGGITRSPSFEAFVPPLGTGDPTVTYISDQLFQSFGDFIGVIIGHELTERPWYAPLVEGGLRIARGLQSMGYVGFFDLDAIVDEDERLYFLETNTRRTGGTHTHDFARFFFGPDYLERVTLLSDDTLSSGSVREVADLHSSAAEFLYPMDGDLDRGVFITGTSALERGEFGVIIAGHDSQDCAALRRDLVAAVARFSPL